jgi:hypothetical protein
VTLTGHASSGLPVGYTTSTPRVCTVAASRLHILAAGRCTVTAHQSGDAAYRAAADVRSSVTVAKAGLTIRASDAVLHKGKVRPAVRPIYRGLVNGDTAPSSAPVCGANLRRMITSCHGAADGNYAISYRNGSLRLRQVIHVRPVGRLTDRSGSIRLHVTSSSSRRVTLTAGPGRVCSVDGQLLTIAAAGRCTVIATVAANSRYAPASRRFTLRIAPTTQRAHLLVRGTVRAE